VPVFWVASDDHDFEEIRSITLLDAVGAPRVFRYAPRQEPVGLPASRIVLDETVVALLDEVEGALPAGPNRDAELARLRRCYRPGTTLSRAFASYLAALLPEIVVLDPADAGLKALMAPVMSRELREGSPTSQAAGEAGARLQAAGYEEQVQVRPGFLNLFVLMDGERRPLATADSAVVVRGIDRRLDIAEAERALEREPALWSPGALLRPLAQDLLLPTVAYVGGPAEIAYHAQIGPAYAVFGIPRPALMPRASVTLIEPSQARALDAEGLSLDDLREDPEHVLARWARESHPEVESAFARARTALESGMAEVGNAVAAVDATLRAAAEGAGGRALHQIEALQEKTVRALKKRDQTRAERLRRTRDALLPGGVPQERALGLAGLLARHGAAAVEEIRGKIDVWARGPQVVKL
jgi:bacillithiol biosynthesis cysteine-adding enzyme BshC